MDLTFKIMLFLHLVALAVGTTATVAMPLIGRQMAGQPAARPALGAIAGQIQIFSRGAFAVLVLSGIAMLWLRFGGDPSALGMWFSLKMALVALIFAIMVLMAVAPGRISPQILGLVMKLALLGTVACAVQTFS
ncbi:hypothetical protein [Aestuariivirga litoralis]|uniref:hypothetical protein n=1 Tax=Aestuariivirga litoralis TaxID=2650924 RepID=UPI0018C7C4AC|nr:hypothetical protein [Aestuariivirga litoralis]MBG1231374.1 hypothetical protein [Aestuariivirga litoralis]